jgi:hypothetical protein
MQSDRDLSDELRELRADIIASKKKVQAVEYCLLTFGSPPSTESPVEGEDEVYRNYVRIYKGYTKKALQSEKAILQDEKAALQNEKAALQNEKAALQQKENLLQQWQQATATGSQSGKEEQSDHSS